MMQIQHEVDTSYRAEIQNGSMGGAEGKGKVRATRVTPLSHPMTPKGVPIHQHCMQFCWHASNT